MFAGNLVGDYEESNLVPFLKKHCLMEKSSIRCENGLYEVVWETSRGSPKKQRDSLKGGIKSSALLKVHFLRVAFVLRHAKGILGALAPTRRSWFERKKARDARIAMHSREVREPRP